MKNLLTSGDTFEGIRIPNKVVISTRDTKEKNDLWKPEVKWLLKILIEKPPTIVCPCGKGDFHWFIENKAVTDVLPNVNYSIVTCANCNYTVDLHGPYSMFHTTKKVLELLRHSKIVGENLTAKFAGRHSLTMKMTPVLLKKLKKAKHPSTDNTEKRVYVPSKIGHSLRNKTRITDFI
jgi:hypothetical protein